MQITATELESEFTRARKGWPFIEAIEAKYGLPEFSLFAVGSRETNLTNEVGDNGHGHGVWQLDDRSHQIPSGFDSDISMQAETAAQILSSEIKRFGEKNGYSVYNSGRPDDRFTTGHNYGEDVLERRMYLVANFTTGERIELSMDRAGMTTLVFGLLAARDPSQDELNHCADTLHVSDREVVLAALDSADGTAIKLHRRSEAGLK